MDRSTRNLLRIGAVFIAMLLFIFVARSLSHLGKTKVVVQVAPDNSSVTLNDQSIKQGTLYLKPGNYTFSAKLSGWRTDTQKVTVTRDSAEVSLLPEPVRTEDIDWLKDHQQVQLERERLGGMKVNQQGAALERNSPIINSLPYTDVEAPFTIDYGPSQKRKDNILLVVSDSDPEGRAKALQWIKQQGYDPTNLEIVFSDFANPTTISSQGGDND